MVSTFVVVTFSCASVHCTDYVRCVSGIIMRLLCFSAVSRNDSSGSLTHHFLFQHHLHGQQSQSQQPQQSAGGQHHRGPGQSGQTPDHGGLLLNPTPPSAPLPPVVIYVPFPPLVLSLYLYLCL